MVRGANPTWPHPYGFVGGKQDGAGTVHLGAREYDPALGRFVSVDPLLDVADPQSYQGYAYANNTPVTATDADGLRMCLEACGSADDKIAEQHRREVDHRVQKEIDDNRRACPRNIPREDCLGDYRTAPQRMVSKQRRYKNGTTLTFYTNGDVEINGYVLPPDHPDPYMLDQLAVRVDELLPRMRPADYPQPTGLAKTIYAVWQSCGRTICSDNFTRAVEKDYHAAYHNKALPSYLRAGRLQPPGMKMPEPPGPPGRAEVVWIFGKWLAMDTLHGYVEILHAYCALGYQKHMEVDAGLHLTERSLAAFGKTLRMASGVSLGVTIGCAIRESFGH
jgi:RHS repeat-associated protein